MERGARTIWTAAGLGLSVLLGAALAMVGDAEGEAGAQGSPTGDGRPDVRRRPGHVVPEDSLYKSPVQLLLSPDGERLYVSCEGSGEVLAMDPRAGRVVGRLVLPDGTSAAGVQIRLDRYPNAIASDKVGIFQFMGVGAGSYRLIVSDTRFAAAERTLDLRSGELRNLGVIPVTERPRATAKLAPTTVP